MSKLKHYRELRGLSQPELAKRARITQAMVSRMEADPKSRVYRKLQGDIAQRIAGVLKVDIFELTGSLDDLAHGLPDREIARIARMIRAFHSGE